MRTTIIVSDELHRLARERARAEGKTFTSYIESLLRRELARPLDAGDEDDVDAYIAEPFNGTGVRPGVDLTSNAAVLELMDEGVPIEKLR